MKGLSLKTPEGCKKLLAIFLCLILLCSFIARMIDTDSGKLKIEKLTFDFRGAALAAEMYYPAGTDANDSYPAVIVTHGGGVNNGVMRPMALEIARRGFVVVNISFYGSGLSEWPEYDDGGQSPETFKEAGTPGGQIDVYEYLKNVSFVDPTRIAVVGHSAGAVRAYATLGYNSSYLTLNDLLINTLYDDFGQTFTEEEITQDADALAAARLNADQLALYEKIAEEIKQDYSTRIKTIISLGSVKYDPAKTVQVAGYDVVRSARVNLLNGTGTYQKNSINSLSNPDNMATFYTDQPIERNTFYALDDASASSTKLGDLSARSEELTAAADARVLRGIGFNTETHSENFFSFGTNANVINMLEVTLNNNSGLATSNQVWLWRVVFNCIAMLAMLACIFPLIALLIRTKFFASAVAVVDEKKRAAFNPKLYWIFAVVTVLVCAFGMYRGNLAGPFAPVAPDKFQFFVGPNQTFVYLFYACVLSVAIIIVSAIMNKKANGTTGLADVFGRLSFVNVLKNMLLALIFICLAYGSLLVIEYCFNEDYRLWMTAFALAKAENWFVAFPYVVCFFVFYVAIGAAINSSNNQKWPAWKDLVLTVIINSAGAYLIWAINAIHNATAFTGAEWSSFTCSFNMLFMIPVTVYITRKMYKLVNNIWLGATLNTLLVTWTLACSGLNAMVWRAQSALSVILGL